MSAATLSAVVMGMPASIQIPGLREGETRLHSTARIFPDDWNNFIDNLKNDFNLAGYVISKIKGCNVKDVDSQVKLEIDRWVKFHYPGYFRTLQGLFELKEEYTKGSSDVIDLIQVIAPLLEENDLPAIPHQRLELNLIPLDNGMQELDLNQIKPLVKGKYLWCVSGGSRFSILTGMILKEMIIEMDNYARIVQFFDGRTSVLYRTSALTEMLMEFGSIPKDHDEIAKYLSFMGFYSRGEKSYSSLCMFEEAYDKN
ncbi:MAG: hypothetical protein XD78_1951 [Desulfotomaculum sp. 46_296]|nr:MAG: hypothetical protein XD78_1951 [Desulfotomaculum sp. 46_296]HAU31300.1 hypothetical protein [Desulfotomaculum sp.]